MNLPSLSLQLSPEVEWSMLPFQVSAFLMCTGAGFSPVNHTKCATAHSFTSLHSTGFPCALEELLPLVLPGNLI